MAELLQTDTVENVVIIFLSDGHDPAYLEACEAMKQLVEAKKDKYVRTFART